VKRALTFVVLAWFTAVVAVVSAGCQSKSAGVPKNESVVDVGYAQQQQPAQAAPVAQQPVADDAFAPAQSTATADASDAGATLAGPYTVKKGDTLYGIAKQRYGDGKQWVRIAEANPGLRPEALKAGQTITLP
jgi:5'-nucleotidase